MTYSLTPAYSTFRSSKQVIYLCHIKNDKLINTNSGLVGSTVFLNEIDKYEEYNIIFELPFISDSDRLINNLCLITKRKLEAPIGYVLYINPELTEKCNTEIDQIAQNYIFQTLYIKVDLNRIKNINLPTIIRSIFQNNIIHKDLRISRSFNNLGFRIKFDLVYQKSSSDYNYITQNYIHEIIETLQIRMFNIVNIKKSIIKLTEQLTDVIDYYQFNRNTTINILKQLNLEMNPVKCILNVTDILNTKRFALLPNDFINYYNSKNWDNEVDLFREFITTTKIIGNSNNVKTINIMGFQIIIKHNISIISPAIIYTNLPKYNIEKLLYILLRYYNKYDDITSAISLIRLRTLSTN